MPLFGHSAHPSAAESGLEKPAPVAQGDRRPSNATAVNSPAIAHHGAAGNAGPVVGNESADGKAWIYQRPTTARMVQDVLGRPSTARSSTQRSLTHSARTAAIAFFVPFFVFALCQIRVRSFEDLNTATFGVLYSLINAACFQVFIKWLIGGLRPHFLAVCAPNITGVTGTGFQSIMYDRSVCTGDRNQINDSLESMPSGHSTAAWAGLLFLSLYLNGKLKLFADYRPQFWKMIAFFAPLLGAFLISGSLTIAEYHHWYDVVIGGIIGSLSALAAYRMSYASVWDFRLNHLPLPRAPPLHSAAVTRRYPYTTESVGGVQPWAGQWRGDVAVAGAPGDAIKRGGFGGGVGPAGMV